MNVDRRALTPQSVNLILKARAKQAGLDPALFSAHGLRSGYLTEAANRGILCPRRCSSRCTSRWRRQRATTITLNGSRAGPHGC
jgi:integrase